MTTDPLALTAATQLGYMGIGVSDLTVWREFATEVLGLQENGRTTRGSILLRMDEHHHRIEVCPTGEDDILWAGWEAKDAAALDRIADQVRALGVAVTVEDDALAAERKVLGLISFTDPNGLRVEVYHGALIDHRPFISPRGVTGFRASDLGLGHIVMVVKNLAESLDFYQRTIGVRISDYQMLSFGPSRFVICFTHVNQRHHSLAMGAMDNPPPTPPEAPKPKRLNHFMLEVDDFDDVGMTLDQFQRRGMTAGQIGKHSNDWMISFYAPTPSGFSVEYGWNGRSIGPEEDWQVQYYRAPSVWGHGMAPSAAPAPGSNQPRPETPDAAAAEIRRATEAE